MRGRSGHLLGRTAPDEGGARRGIGDHGRSLRPDAWNSGRRAFLLTGLGATIASLAGRVAFGGGQWEWGAHADPAPDPAGPRLPLVCEVRSRELRAALAGGTGRSGVSELLLGALSVLSGEDLPPLDALTDLFPGDPPVAILVDAGASGPFTRLLATELASALVDMGSAAGSVAIAEASDAALAAGGYRIVREGQGPLCRGTEPAPGYQELPPGAEGAGRLRVSKLILGERARLCVVGRLASRSGRMGPFVLDAALRGLDRETRERALRDPSFGAKLLAEPPFGERVGLVAADLVEIPLDPPENGEASGSAVGRDGAWPAGELLVGSDLFAVECVGHRILANALEGRGMKAPAPHPILAAAAALGIPGARIETLAWKKASL